MMMLVLINYLFVIVGYLYIEYIFIINVNYIFYRRHCDIFYICDFNIVLFLNIVLYRHAIVVTSASEHNLNSGYMAHTNKYDYYYYYYSYHVTILYEIYEVYVITCQHF